MAAFFISRPVFAWVLALITMLAGGFAVSRLAIEQYPDIAPIRINVSATYPGASAEAVANSVTTVIEGAMNGLDGLEFMTSTSSATGRAFVSLTFADGVGAELAQSRVQTRVQQIESTLPEVVRDRGLNIWRSGESTLMVGALVSRDNRWSTMQLGDLMAQVVEDAVLRTEGVGEIENFSAGYAMRIWLDPMRMAQYQLTTADITQALAEQNTTVSVGSLGAQPVVPGQQLTVALSAQSQLTSVDEFESILLKVETDGAQVLLSDVARVEIGPESFGANAYFEGANAAGFSVTLASGANAVATGEAVRQTLAGLASALPEGVEVVYPYDTTPFIQDSIQTVYKTLIEAIVLVVLVILIFLQSWRATLVPGVAVPVVLLGTFAVLSAMGYTINTLTMFALVLAIGLLVDDAIVVVENVERVMEEDHLPPREATRVSMRQITGALIGIVVVLSAVFLPMAFMGGATGVIYRQFSVTIISAMVISLAVALILSPAMCASMLKGHRPAADGTRRRANVLARGFNAGLDRVTRIYVGLVDRAIRAPLLVIMVLLGVGLGAGLLLRALPSSFVPQEDQGVLSVNLRLSDGATTAQTEAVAEEVINWLEENHSASIDTIMSALGTSFGQTGQNVGSLYIKLKPFADRPGLSAAALEQDATRHFRAHRAGNISFSQPPAIQGLGVSAGLSFYLVDQGGQGQIALEAAAQALAERASDAGIASNFRGHEPNRRPALRLDIDQKKARAMGISVPEVNSMLAVLFSGRQVGDFELGAELRPVMVQADAPFRMQPEDINLWHARNRAGEMVPFSAFITPVWDENSPSLNRHDGTRALSISANPGETLTSGEAMAAIEALVADIPGGHAIAWTGLSWQERLAGNQAPLLFAMSALVVFLGLAALYESWTVPFSVMLSVPVGVAGALVAAMLFGQTNDVYFKVGLLTTIGLAARNAILIVEFAESLRRQGVELREAARRAAELRFRPILMTSFAFALGVLPLTLATGAGAAAQHAIGIGVLGGVIASSTLALFMVPALHVIVVRLSGNRAPAALED